MQLIDRAHDRACDAAGDPQTDQGREQRDDDSDDDGIAQLVIRHLGNDIAWTRDYIVPGDHRSRVLEHSSRSARGLILLTLAVWCYGKCRAFIMTFHNLVQDRVRLHPDSAVCSIPVLAGNSLLKVLRQRANAGPEILVIGIGNAYPVLIQDKGAAAIIDSL